MYTSTYESTVVKEFRNVRVVVKTVNAANKYLY